MASPAICIDGLTKSFGQNVALSGVSLSVPAGAMLGLLGPNGAGKTTMIRLLLGLLEPSAGSATVLGWDVRRDADQIRAHAGALLEHSGLYERLGAEDNLELFGRLQHMAPEVRRIRIRSALEQMKLWDRRHEPVAGWSRGMKQRLAIARALLHEPTIVFLDEPTAGLDPVAARDLREDLAALAAVGGVTVVLTTHNLHEAERLCSLVVMMRKGKVIASGAPRDLASRHASLEDVFVELMEES